MKLVYVMLVANLIDCCLAQEKPKHLFSSLELAYLHGTNLLTNDFVKGENSRRIKLNKFSAYTLKLTKQTRGEKTWERLYNYPSYGVGLILGNFKSPEEIGYPIGLYTFFRAPFVRGSKLVLNYEVGWGIATNFKPYHENDNPYNIAIGSRETLMGTFSAILQYQLTDYLDLNASGTFTHYSNATLKSPNSGLNTFSPRLSLRYHLQPKPEYLGKSREVLPYKTYEYLISTVMAVKDVPLDRVVNGFNKYQSLKFFILGLKFRINRQISNKSKFGLGTDLNYNGTNHKIVVENGKLKRFSVPLKDKFSSSLFLAYELAVNKIALLVQYGFYVYRREVDFVKPATYQRIGLRYDFAPRLFAAMTLKSYYFSVADFIGWNIGYRL